MWVSRMSWERRGREGGPGRGVPRARLLEGVVPRGGGLGQLALPAVAGLAEGGRVVVRLAEQVLRVRQVTLEALGHSLGLRALGLLVLALGPGLL